MSDVIVRDYLGHPSKLAEALERFSEDLTTARMREAPEVGRQIGVLLTELAERGANAYDALELALKSCPDDTDGDGVRSLLVMAVEYERKSSQRFAEFAGLVLSACERADLVAAAHA